MVLLLDTLNTAASVELVAEALILLDEMGEFLREITVLLSQN